MTLKELVERTRGYIRDKRKQRFDDEEIEDYINEGIDRLKSNVRLKNLPYVVHEVLVLPEQYCYILAIYAASRCFGIDNDFYQEEQKRNEFETVFAELISAIENNEVIITDVEHENDFVQDVYFNRTGSSNEDEVIS